MGLRSWLAGLLTAEEPSTGDEETADRALELRVDVDRREGSIMEQYDLAAEDARRIAEILDAELHREDGYARTMIVDRIVREVDVDEDRARTIVDTEVASIRNLARVRKFTAQTDDVRLRWIDSVGKDDSAVCADVRAAIDEEGPVTVERLRELIREAAAEYEEGTPERAGDLIPHESCRHTVVRHVDAN